MADEKLLHEEDVIFNKPSLKEFIRLIKNGSIQGIWPSTYEEFQEWNNTIYKQYPRGKQIESIDTSMTVLFADNLDNQNSDTLDLDKTTQRFNALKDEVTAIQESIIQDNYFDTIGIDNDTEYDMEYPDFILNSQDGSTNGNEIINNSEKVINKYKNNLTMIEDLINKLINFKPNKIPTDPVISDNAEAKYQLFFTNQTDEIKTNLQSVIPIEYNLDELLGYYQIIQKDICFLENIPNIYLNIINNLNIIKNNIHKYYDNVINDTIYDDIEIIETKINKYNLNELNSSLLTYFDSISDLSINNINKILNFQISELDLNNIKNEKTDQELYNEYIQPYEFLIQYLFYFENNAEITLQNEAVILKNNYVQNIQNEIKSKNEYEEKINIINNLYYDLNNRISNIPQLNFVYYIQNNLETLTDIKLLADGNIKNYSLIITWLNRGLNIVSAEFTLLNHYNISDNTLDYIYPVLKDTIFQKLDQIIEKPNEDKGDNRTYFKIDLDSIYEKINNIYNKYNQILINISTNIFPETPIVNFIIDDDNSFSNRDSVIQSINNLYQKIMEHYNVLDAIGFGLEVTKQNLLNEKEYLINLITAAQVEIEYIGTEQEFNEKIKQYFTENIINNLILRITNNHKDAVFSNDKIYPIIDDKFLNIINKQDVINSLNTIKQIGESINRLSILTQRLNNLEEKINNYTPIYLTDSIKHFFCFDVRDNISFDNEVTIGSELNDQEKNILKDGTLGIKINSKYHYPKIYNLADNITDQTRNTQIPTIGGLKSIFGNDFNKIGNITLGNDYTPLYLQEGTFKTATKIISGLYTTKLIDDKTPGWKVIDSSLNLTSLQANKIFGAVYNDYAEYRSAEANPGRCIIENGDGTLSLSSGRLQLGANIVSDTYGFAIGETNKATCPVAVCGRVLAYPLESKEFYHPGAAVCSGPEGTVSLMTREEIREWPDAIIGYVSEVPTYDTWGSDNIPVNGRIWIKIK